MPHAFYIIAAIVALIPLFSGDSSEDTPPHKDDFLVDRPNPNAKSSGGCDNELSALDQQLAKILAPQG